MTKIEKEKIIIEKVINSYCGKDGWGYNCVHASDGKIYNVKQEPQSSWQVGDDITNAKKSIEI